MMADGPVLVDILRLIAISRFRSLLIPDRDTVVLFLFVFFEPGHKDGHAAILYPLSCKYLGLLIPKI